MSESVTSTGSNDLTPDEMQFIAEHVAESAEYLSHLNSLWFEEGDDQMVDAAEIDLPEITAEQAAVLRGKVFGTIQRDSFSAKTVRLGTEGFAKVLVALVRPLIGSRPHKE